MTNDTDELKGKTVSQLKEIAESEGAELKASDTTKRMIINSIESNRKKQARNNPVDPRPEGRPDNTIVAENPNKDADDDTVEVQSQGVVTSKDDPDEEDEEETVEAQDSDGGGTKEEKTETNSYEDKDEPDDAVQSEEEELVVVKFSGVYPTYIIGSYRFSKDKPFKVMKKSDWEKIKHDIDLAESSKEEAEDYYSE